MGVNVSSDGCIELRITAGQVRYRGRKLMVPSLIRVLTCIALHFIIFYASFCEDRSAVVFEFFHDFP
jgi:hypothetical protein